MGRLRAATRSAGGVVSVAGLVLASTFVGVRTADPVASNVVDLTLQRQIAGVLAGLLLFGVGLGVARLAMPDEKKGA